MADAAVIIGLVAVALHAIRVTKKYVDDIVNAPKAVQSMSSSLESLHGVLSSLLEHMKDPVFEHNEANDGILAILQQPLRLCKEDSGTLTRMLNPFVNHSGKATMGSLSRFAFRFRKAKINGIRSRLDSSKVDLDAAVNIATFITSRQTSKGVRHVAQDVDSLIRGFRRLMLRQGWDTTSITNSGYAGSEAPQTECLENILQWIQRAGTDLETTSDDRAEVASRVSIDSLSQPEFTDTANTGGPDHRSVLPSPLAVDLGSHTASRTPRSDAAGCNPSIQAANNAFTSGDVTAISKKVGLEKPHTLGLAAATSTPMIPDVPQMSVALISSLGKAHQNPNLGQRFTGGHLPPVLTHEQAPRQNNIRRATPAIPPAQRRSGYKVLPLLDMHDPNGIGGDTMGLVVGIDIGIRYTTVVYSLNPKWDRPETLQHWPEFDKASDTVPTRLGYVESPGKLARWGFELDGMELSISCHNPFTTSVSDSLSQWTSAEAQRWLTDYLERLHDWVQGYFVAKIPAVRQGGIAYVFSCPVVWAMGRWENTLRDSIWLAGFGKDLGHSISHIRSKPVAVALSIPGQPFTHGETLLVCDVGSDSIEVTCLRLISAQRDFEILTNCSSEAIGSDLHVERLLGDCLRTASSRLSGDPLALAQQMIRSSRYELYKTSLGREGQLQNLAVALTVPKMAPGVEIPEAGIFDSKITIQSEDVMSQIDKQLLQIFELIDAVAIKQPEISSLIFTGELAEIPYARQAVRALYSASKLGRNDDPTPVLEVWIPQHPKLAAARGLVRSQTPLDL